MTEPLHARARRLHHGLLPQRHALRRRHSDLARRAHQHRKGAIPGFTRRYGCKLLVWCERYDLITDAIAREKQIKAGARTKKLALIEAANPQWRDLYLDLNE